MRTKNKLLIFGSALPVIIASMLIFSTVKAAYTGPGYRTIQTGLDWKRNLCTITGDMGNGLVLTDTLPRYMGPTASCPTWKYPWASGTSPWGACYTWVDYNVWVEDYYGIRCQPTSMAVNVYSGWYMPPPDSSPFGNVHLYINTYLEDCTSGQDACATVPHFETYDPAEIYTTPNCSDPGNGGWCKGDGSLALDSYEPIPGESITKIETATETLCDGPSCTYTLPEGITTLTYWAVSSFGDTSAQASTTMQIDRTQPSVTLQQEYISATEVRLYGITSDSGSGLGQAQLSLDGGSTWEALSPDGSGAWERVVDLLGYSGGDVIEVVQRSTDVAGNENEAYTVVTVDGEPPEITMSQEDVSATVVRLFGTAIDTGVGMDKAELSLDGGSTWETLTLSGSGAWEKTMDTSSVPEGETVVAVLRATDLIGNESESSVSFLVTRIPSQIRLSDPWYLPDSGTLEVIEGGIPFDAVIVTICDPAGHFSCIVRNYGHDDVPSSVDWDGFFGTEEAPAGDYDVTAKVFDRLGRVEVAESAIIIPEPEPLFAFAKTAPTPTPEPTPQIDYENEGDQIRFYGLVDFYNGSTLIVGHSAYIVTSEAVVDESNGEVREGVLVSGIYMSESKRVVSVRTLAVQTADGDEYASFQGVIDFWSVPDGNGDTWMVINELGYHLTPQTAITGDPAEGSYVSGIIKNGLVVSMWVSSPGEDNSLIGFSGTVSAITGNVDQRPFTLTIEGLNYKVTGDSVITGDALEEGAYVSGSALGNDRSILGMQVSSKKPGLWSIALDFLNSKQGNLVKGGAALMVVASSITGVSLKRRKTKKEQAQAVDDAVDKLS